jgi:hypothetical protein
MAPSHPRVEVPRRLIADDTAQYRLTRALERHRGFCTFQQPCADMRPTTRPRDENLAEQISLSRCKADDRIALLCHECGRYKSGHSVQEEGPISQRAFLRGHKRRLCLMPDAVIELRDRRNIRCQSPPDHRRFNINCHKLFSMAGLEPAIQTPLSVS